MSCLFNSLAPSVSLHPTILRKSIVSYLKTNPKLLDDIKAKDIINWSENKSFENYTNNMLSTDTWGGAIEIKAFCELYNKNVRIYITYTGKSFTINSSKNTSDTVNIKYNGSHYTTFN